MRCLMFDVVCCMLEMGGWRWNVGDVAMGGRGRGFDSKQVK
jgi:hypothetical protein